MKRVPNFEKEQLRAWKKSKKNEYYSQMCFLNFLGQKDFFGMLGAQNI